MSRLSGRIRRLEERYGDCPSCRGRTTLLEMVTPDGRRSPRAKDADRSSCPDCGAPREVIEIVLAYDPDAFPDYDAQPCEGEREGRR